MYVMCSPVCTPVDMAYNSEFADDGAMACCLAEVHDTGISLYVENTPVLE